MHAGLLQIQLCQQSIWAAWAGCSAFSKENSTWWDVISGKTSHGLQEYYPFSTEKQMLADHAEDIITHIPEGSVVVELGCGTAEKTATLLQALMAR